MPRKKRPTRASARQKDSVFVDLVSPDDSEDEDEDELPKFTGIRIKRPPRTVQPSYGIVREVEQMYDSDDDTAPLRAHRDTCEKCGRAAAHVLLSGWTRKSKKGKKRWSRSDIDADLLESSDGEATFEKLGGWVRWLVVLQCTFPNLSLTYSQPPMPPCLPLELLVTSGPHGYYTGRSRTTSAWCTEVAGTLAL